MATIQFKAKAEPFQYAGETEPRYMRVKVPMLDRKHCDMAAFRKHPKYGAYANSDLFKGMLSRIKADRLGNYVNLSNVPEGVEIAEGYLVTVTVTV